MSFFTITNANATIYYSGQNEGWAEDPDVINVNNWNTQPDGSGAFPANFTSGDEFHIINGDAMLATGVWTISGAGSKLVIETGGYFLANGFNHVLTLDMEANATYSVSTTYTSLTFGTLNSSSVFEVTGTVLRTGVTYGGLTITGPTTFPTTLSGTLTVTGNLLLSGSRVINISAGTARVVTVGGNLSLQGTSILVGANGSASSTINITGDLEIAGGTLRGSSNSGSPSFTIGGNFNMTSGSFIGTSGTGNPSFTISGNFLKTGGSYSAVSGGSGFPTFTLTGSSKSISLSSLNNSNHNITIAGTYSIAGDVTVGRTLHLSSGSLSIGAHELTLNHNLTVGSGSLIGGLTSTLTFAAAASGATIPAMTLATLNIDRTGQQIDMGGALTVGTLLNLNSGTLAIGNNTLTINGAFTSNGTLSGGSTSNIIVGGLAASAINLPAVVLNNLTLNRTAGIGMDGAISVAGTLTLTAGTLDNTLQTLTLNTGSTISRDNGALAAAPTFAGTVNLIYTGLTAVNTSFELPSVSSALNNLTISKTGGVSLQSSTQVNGTFTISAGSQLSANAQTLTIMGPWINNNIFNANTGTVNFNGTTTLSGSGTHTFNNVGIGVGGSLTPPSSSTLTINGNFANNGTFTHNSGTVSFNGSGNQTISGSSTTQFNHLTITKSGLSNIVSMSSSAQVDGTFTIAAGAQLSANSSTLTIMSSWVDNGTFDAGTGTVNFNGTTTLSGSATHAFNTIVIGGSLTPPASATITLTGNFTNNGTFTHNSGTVTFNGNNTQSIAGSTLTDFNNITVTKSSLANVVSLSSAQRLISTLTLSNSTSAFSTNGQTFTLVSNGSGTARIAAIPSGASFSGDITMQRFIPATSGRYTYHLSSPVSNAPVSHWQTGAPTTGIYITGPFTGASNPGNGITSTSVSMQTFNAGTGAYSTYPTASNGEILSPRVGFRVFVRDGGASQAPSTSAKTISVTGTPNTGNQVFNLSYAASGGVGSPAGGWNFLGNPYPSEITANLNASGWSKGGLAQNAVYIWDADAQTYVSCNSGTGNCTIPSSQGFWVQVNSSGFSLAADENVKVSSTSTPIYRKAISGDHLNIKLINDASFVSNTSYLKIDTNSTDNFDPEMDAYKLDNRPGFTISPSAVSVATKGGTTYYSINNKPTLADSDTIPLYIATRTGSNTLDFSDNSLNVDEIYLIDQYAGTSIDLKADPIYQFNVTSDTNTQRGRFQIVFRSSATTTGILNKQETLSGMQLYPNPLENNSTTLLLNNVTGESADIEVSDMTGIEVYSKTCKVSNGKIEENLKLEGLTNGIYMVKCRTAKGVYTQKLIVQ